MALEKILKNSSGIPTGEYERIAGGTLYADNPIGAIVPFGGTKIPAGFLLCNGAEVLKTDYAELYAVIGDAFGTASVNTKFVLPDLREATTKGVGLTGKSNNHYDSDGVALGEFVEDRVQEHTHSVDYNSPTTGTPGNGVVYDDTTQKTNTSTNSGRSGDTTEVKAVGVNYIIKAKMVALPADLEAQVEEIATKYPDYSQPITIDANPWTAPEDCYVSYLHVNTDQNTTIVLRVDSSIVTKLSGPAGGTCVSMFSGYVRKGQVLQSGGGSTDLAGRCLAWKLT